MIDSIIEWSLRNRFVVVLLGIGLLVWGAWEASRMPVDVFPSLSATTVPIIVEAHGMAPEEIESQAVYPIETALNGASGIRRVRSATGIGNAVIWAEFDWDTDIFRARQLVSERLQQVRASLPPEVEPPTMAPISSIMGEIMFVALTSEKHTPVEVRTEADWNVRRRLLAVPGIAQVIPIGGGVKQYPGRRTAGAPRRVQHGARHHRRRAGALQRQRLGGLPQRERARVLDLRDGAVRQDRRHRVDAARGS